MGTNHFREFQGSRQKGQPSQRAGGKKGQDLKFDKGQVFLWGSGAGWRGRDGVRSCLGYGL